MIGELSVKSEDDEQRMKNGQATMSGEIFLAISRCQVTTCLGACHLSYYSSGPNLIVAISHDKTRARRQHLGLLEHHQKSILW